MEDPNLLSQEVAPVLIDDEIIEPRQQPPQDHQPESPKKIQAQLEMCQVMLSAARDGFIL